MAISRSSKQGFKQRPTEWKMKEAEFRLTYKRRDILAVNLIFLLYFNIYFGALLLYLQPSNLTRNIVQNGLVRSFYFSLFKSKSEISQFSSFQTKMSLRNVFIEVNQALHTRTQGLQMIVMFISMLQSSEFEIDRIQHIPYNTYLALILDSTFFTRGEMLSELPS